MGSQQSLSSCYCLNNNQHKPLKQSAVIQLSQNNNKFLITGQLNFNKQSTFKKLQIVANQYCQNTKIGPQYVPVVMRLLAYNHENIFEALGTLGTQNSKIQLVDKICEIDLDLMDSLYKNLVLDKEQQKNTSLSQSCAQHSKKQKIKPLSLSQLSLSEKKDLQMTGRGLLREGKVAIVFMCSGPSSRFYFQDKFLHPLQVQNEDSSLLKIMFQKLRQNILARKQHPDQRILIDIPIVLIGNQTNSSSLEDYLKENNFFEFSKYSIYFSTIPSIPILDKQGKLCMNFQYNYLRRPQGSACCLEEIIHPQAMEILRQKQVQYVHVVGVENLAESPGDPVFIGLTKMLKRNVSMKCVRMNNEEGIKFDRILSSNNNKLKIISPQISQEQQTDSIMHLELQASQKSQQSLIALNSIIFELLSLQSLVERFNYNPEKKITPSYRCYGIRENVYDFRLRRPILNEKCYTFQKDIKDTIVVADRPLLVEVQNFIPIITHKCQYSVQEGIERYEQILRNKIRGTEQTIQMNMYGHRIHSSSQSSTNSFQPRINVPSYKDQKVRIQNGKKREHFCD